MENNIKSIVYLTINIKNLNIYVGVHMTENPYVFDGYLGCGIKGPNCYQFKHPKTPFQHAVKKYGFDSFKRITLYIFDNYDDALLKEAEIVNEEFIKRKDTYNCALGGNGSVINRQIRIYAYNLDGTFKCEFDSYSNAARQLNCSYMSLINAVKYKSVTQNLYWSNEKCDKLDISEYTKPQNRIVFLYNNNGNYLQAFTSIEKCAQYLQTSHGTVSKALESKTKVKEHYVSNNYVEKFHPKEHKRLRNVEFYQYDLDGNFIQKWNSKKEAAEKLNLDHRQISYALLHDGKYDKYQWKYEKFDKILPHIKKSSKKPVLQYDLNGNFIKEWESYTECRKEFPNVHKCLVGKLEKTKGYVFKYKNVEDIV